METKGRRTFLRNLFTGGAALVVTRIAKAKSTNKEKVRLLTADGKLVEVDKSIVEDHGNSTNATNNDVISWMNTNPKNA